MNEVDVLVVFSNRYHYGINSIDVEVVKTRFLFFFRLGNVSASNRKQEIDKTQFEGGVLKTSGNITSPSREFYRSVFLGKGGEDEKVNK